VPARWGKSDLGISQTFSDNSKLIKLKSFLPNNAKVIAGPDESGCIYLYFLHKKGYGYERATQLTELKDGKLLLENYIYRGAEYLITSDALDIKNEMLINHYDSIIQYNEFYIVKLKK
jgi:hypothetical protein